METFGRGQTPTDRAGQPAELAPPYVFLANTAGVPMLWVPLVTVTLGVLGASYADLHRLDVSLSAMTRCTCVPAL